MPSQQLHLSWKDHHGILVSVFENLFKNNALVDCTLAAEGQYLKAHKMVLSACSSYFELLFRQESEKNPIVILKDVGFQELEAAVNFMYRGEVEVQEDRLAVFLDVADSLQIKGLGSDRKTQRSKEKSSSSMKVPSRKSVSPQQWSGKAELSSRSDSAGQNPNISVPADCELVRNNESSAVHQTFRSETSHSSPTPRHSSSFSQSCLDTNSDNHENSHSSITVPQFSPRENEQSDINPVFKTEPMTDMYGEENSNEADGDFEDDVKMIDDEEDWDEDNVETMNDEPSTRQQDVDASGSQRDDAQNFSSILGKDKSSISSSWSHQEPYSSAKSGTSVEKPTASTGAGWTQEDSDQNFSCVVVKEEPGTSWNHQEPSTSTESDPSIGTPAASTGDVVAVHPENPYSQPSAWSPTQFYDTGTTNSDIPAKSLDSSLQLQEPHQPEAENLICLLCQNVFSSISELVKHMPFHRSSGIHKCPLCNYSTLKLPLMTEHLRTHTTERPYKCPLCTFSSKTKRDLTTHIRTHTGEKPYQCPECDYKGNTSSGLIVHRRTHTGEKPYQCLQCDYKANHLSHLKRHRHRKHSGEKRSNARLIKNLTHQYPFCD